MNKKGFTLVELLAVIVILAVILVIAIPQISNVIKETKKNSLGSTAKIIAAKAEEKEVENEALENNEELSCASLVKLDNNYGNCTVTVNDGVATVTIRGANKFAGYKCTGTKNNMNCTEVDPNAPEYVYSYYFPDYATYVVTNSALCKSYIKNYTINEWNVDNENAEWFAHNICDGRGIIDVDAETGAIYSYTSTSDWFYESIQYGDLTYNDISVFVEEKDNPVLVNVVEDYTELNKSIFLRWAGDTINFDANDSQELCVLINENLTCFNPNDSYSINKSKVESLFDSNSCNIYTTSYDAISCQNQTTNLSCYVSDNEVAFSINDGINYVGCSIYDGYRGDCGIFGY